LDFSKILCSLVVPLLVLMKRLLDGDLAFFDSSESGENLLPLHLLFMVSLSRERR
jgi:hypothetical protein